MWPKLPLQVSVSRNVHVPLGSWPAKTGSMVVGAEVAPALPAWLRAGPSQAGWHASAAVWAALSHQFPRVSSVKTVVCRRDRCCRLDQLRCVEPVRPNSKWLAPLGAIRLAVRWPAHGCSSEHLDRHAAQRLRPAPATLKLTSRGGDGALHVGASRIWPSDVQSAGTDVVNVRLAAVTCTDVARRLVDDGDRPRALDRNRLPEQSSSEAAPVGAARTAESIVAGRERLRRRRAVSAVCHQFLVAGIAEDIRAGQVAGRRRESASVVAPVFAKRVSSQNADSAPRPSPAGRPRRYGSSVIEIARSSNRAWRRSPAHTTIL